MGLKVNLKASAPIPLDASFDVAPGELMALVGPSGSGKSTTLRTIAGLWQPTEGIVSFNGKPWYDTSSGINVPPQHRAVGIVFQSYALFPHMTALGNVIAAMGLHPSSERQARAKTLLDLVHLTGLEGRKPSQLSGGQQQRVAVARALARDPDVLLLDEPFSAVDKTTRQRLYVELAELRTKLSMPIILVTHDFDEAARLADRMCLLDRGRVIQVGEPAEVLARPASIAAARLVDLKNMFSGQIIRHEGDNTLIDWGGRMIVARRHEAFQSGEAIIWALPSTQVILQRTESPDGESGENLLTGTVKDLMSLSESTAITVEVSGSDAPVLSMTVPAHFARRTGLSRGTPVAVRLLSEGIHVMRDGDGTEQ